MGHLVRRTSTQLRLHQTSTERSQLGHPSSLVLKAQIASQPCISRMSVRCKRKRRSLLGCGRGKKVRRLLRVTSAACSRMTRRLSHRRHSNPEHRLYYSAAAARDPAARGPRRPPRGTLPPRSSTKRKNPSTGGTGRHKTGRLASDASLPASAARMS